MNNLLTGVDAQARSVISALKLFEGTGDINGTDAPVTDGTLISVDPTGKVHGSFIATKDNLIKINMLPTGPDTPKWQALHFQIGNLNIEEEMVLGIVIKSQAPSSITSRICIRSGVDGEFIDTMLPKTLVSYSEPSVHLDLLDLSKTPDFPSAAEWRDLIIFFRPGEVDIEISEIRFFVV
nr:hypothetical protein [uncultured Cohaesibacter sp.]